MKIFVLDTETTGLNGAPEDCIVDIGVVRLDTQSGSVIPVYNQVIRSDVDTWDERQKNAWIFSHSDLTVEAVATALMNPADMVSDMNLLAEITHFPWTSYNIKFDFGKFLNRDPWNFCPRMYTDVMEIASRYVNGDVVFDDGRVSWPKLEKAYRKLCPEDPAHIEKQTHRALSDAIQAAYVLDACLRLEEDSMGDYDYE